MTRLAQVTRLYKITFRNLDQRDRQHSEIVRRQVAPTLDQAVERARRKALKVRKANGFAHVRLELIGAEIFDHADKEWKTITLIGPKKYALHNTQEDCNA